MSVEDALKQKKELEEKMDPKMVAFFRNRNRNRNRNNNNNMNMNKSEDKGSTAPRSGNHQNSSKYNKGTSNKPDAMKLMKANVDPMSRVHARMFDSQLRVNQSYR